MGNILNHYEDLAKLCRSMRVCYEHEVSFMLMDCAKSVKNFYEHDFVQGNVDANYFFCLYFKYRAFMMEINNYGHIGNERT